MKYLFYLLAFCLLYFQIGLVIAYAESCVLTFCDKRTGLLASLRRVAVVAATWPVVVAAWVLAVGRWLMGRASR